jgi:hypothetical protein
MKKQNDSINGVYQATLDNQGLNIRKMKHKRYFRCRFCKTMYSFPTDELVENYCEFCLAKGKKRQISEIFADKQVICEVCKKSFVPRTIIETESQTCLECLESIKHPKERK